jgi:hypothetical protein
MAAQTSPSRAAVCYTKEEANAQPGSFRKKVERIFVYPCELGTVRDVRSEDFIFLPTTQFAYDHGIIGENQLVYR